MATSATSHHKIVGGTRRREERKKINKNKNPSFARTTIETRPSIWPLKTIEFELHVLCFKKKDNIVLVGHQFPLGINTWFSHITSNWLS